MRIPILTAILTALIVALGAVWFFSTFERVVVEVPAAYEGEARFNDFLAAELLLTEVDVETDARASLNPVEWLPPPTDTLIVRANPGIAAPGRRELLRDWVSSGGHLMLAAPRETTALIDGLFLEFSIFLTESPVALDDDAAGQTSLAPRARSQPGTATYAIASSFSPVRFELADAVDFAALADGLGIFAARRAFGAGFVTVVADAAIFGNAALATGDNGRLLLDSVVGFVDPGKVWFVYDASFPPLWQLIWDRLAYFVLGTAFLAALWLWAVIPRFGSPLTAENGSRRSILEHVVAAARFTWAYDGAAALVQSTVDGVISRAELRRPGIARLPADARAERIAGLAEVDAASVRDALDPSIPPARRAFAQRIRTLQAIRKKL